MSEPTPGRPPVKDEPLEQLTFSATEAIVDAGGSYELPVPTDPVDGSFLIYHYDEKSGDGIRFTVTTDAGRELVDELQARSNEQILVTGATRCTLRWDNTDAWLTPKAISYSVKIVSAGCVQAKLEERLLHASEHGPLSVLRECLGRGLSIECTSKDGHTPLMRAALASGLHRGETAKLLLEARASTHAIDRHGNTPLHLCALGGNRTTLALLVERGAELHALNAEGASPLHLAAFTGRADAVEYMLGARADPNVADARSNGALHLASAAGHTACVRCAAPPWAFEVGCAAVARAVGGGPRAVGRARTPDSGRLASPCETQRCRPAPLFHPRHLPPNPPTASPPRPGCCSTLVPPPAR